jgi:hypothetical protein
MRGLKPSKKRKGAEMASTDIDGTQLMIIGEGATIALVIGERSYLGTLRMRKDGFQEFWFIKLTVVASGEPDEIQIHKVKTDEPPTPRTEPEGAN